MAYTKTTWKNGETPLNADNLNNLEDGVASNDSRITTLEGTIPESGKDGLSLLTGHGEPIASLGNKGDSYIDLDSWDYYTKGESAWSADGNIKGERGPQGPKGDTGGAGSQGAPGITWKPTVDSTGKISWAQDATTTKPDDANIKGVPGDTWKPSVTAEGVLSWMLDRSSAVPTQQTIKGKDGITPNIDDNGFWAFNGVATKTKAQGVDGFTPTIGSNGNWFINNIDQKKKAIGVDGQPGKDGATWKPSVNSSTGDITWTKDSSSTIPSTANIKGPQGNPGDTPTITADGYWKIGTTTTTTKAKGTDGKDGVTPTIGNNGNWFLGTTDTNKPSQGNPGYTPTIGSNGNWYINNVDQKVKAKGTDGITPTIDSNGYWSFNGVATSTKAKGEDGKPGSNGITPTIGANGNWYLGDTDTNKPSRGDPGASGKTWKPSVDDSGNLTWVEDDSSTAPTEVNIKGPKGDKGDTGPRGPAGASGQQNVPTNVYVDAGRSTTSLYQVLSGIHTLLLNAYGDDYGFDITFYPIADFSIMLSGSPIVGGTMTLQSFTVKVSYSQASHIYGVTIGIQASQRNSAELQTWGYSNLSTATSISTLASIVRSDFDISFGGLNGNVIPVYTGNIITRSWSQLIE